MIRFVIVVLFMYCGTAWSAPLEHKLLCNDGDNEHGSSAGLILAFEGVEIFLDNTDRGCRAEYVYREALDGASNSLIFSYPTSDDMGLNAQIIIFAAPDSGGVARYIGSIPVGATELEDGNYEGIQQSGNSIYKNIYRIERREVVVTYGKELIISGKQCVYRDRSDSACQEMLGSFSSPVCVFNDGERKVLAAMNECADMKQ